MFGRFAVMEDEHMATLARRYHATPPALPVKISHAAIFAGLDSHPEDPANLFRIAIAFERRAVEFFEGHLSQCEPGTSEHSLYRELAAEEREHVSVLITELMRWQAGKPGLMA